MAIDGWHGRTVTCLVLVFILLVATCMLTVFACIPVWGIPLHVERRTIIANCRTTLVQVRSSIEICFVSSAYGAVELPSNLLFLHSSIHTILSRTFDHAGYLHCTPMKPDLQTWLRGYCTDAKDEQVLKTEILVI